MDSDNRLFEYAGHWLVLRPDTPNFYIYWCRPGTRRVLRRSTGARDFELAKRRLIEFAEGRHVAASPSVGTVPTGQMSLAATREVSPVLLDLMCAYVERLPDDRRARSVAESSLKVFSEFCRKNDLVYVRELNLDAQEHFAAWRRQQIVEKGRAASNATINRDFSVVKAALRDAWKRGRLTAVPHVLSLPNPPGRSRYLTVEEVQRLLHACGPRHLYLFVLLALHTLQRPSAIFSLHKSQIDFVNRRIDFLQPGAMQSNKRRPVVPMTPTLMRELTRAIADSQSGYIVERCGKPISSVRKTFPVACHEAGLSGVTPYILRHTGATLLAANGVPMRQIAGMLGHTTQKVTELYAKHAPEFLQEAADKIESLFNPDITYARQVRANGERADLGIAGQLPEPERSVNASTREAA